jgi:hypothetical protein
MPANKPWDFDFRDAVVVRDHQATERLYRKGERVLWPRAVPLKDWVRLAGDVVVADRATEAA